MTDKTNLVMDVVKAVALAPRGKENEAQAAIKTVLQEMLTYINNLDDIFEGQMKHKTIAAKECIQMFCHQHKIKLEHDQ